MQITLDNDHLRCEFRYTQRTGPAITERIKRIQGWEYDGETKTWWVPASEGHRLLALFPKAQFDVPALWACTDAEAALGHRFYRMCRSLGIALHLDAAGNVFASGDNVSQEVATEVARRSEMLRPYVAAQHDEAPVAQPFADAQPTAADERMAAGLRNAWRRDQRKRGMAAAQRRKRRQA